MTLREIKAVSLSKEYICCNRLCACAHADLWSS